MIVIELMKLRNDMSVFLRLDDLEKPGKYFSLKKLVMLHFPGLKRKIKLKKNLWSREYQFGIYFTGFFFFCNFKLLVYFPPLVIYSVYYNIFHALTTKTFRTHINFSLI